ncbi:sugar ABC transporter substrate-binding protein [Microcella sp.]|uniref:sugar ABC transporter substrate-binding protein n=1 Tax=Microcella sp. TaxID=1913979 RepID=UPI00256938EC|nr:extracellular solute-binding protein [Microcella sp.]MBX9472253.1 extracellular solute-binding protein [Microcella sp.]
MRTSQWSAAALAAGLVVTLAACSSADEGGDGDVQTGQELTMLIGSSGDAETTAVQAAADAWAAETGNTVEVIAANDLVQQLGQGFSGNNPPDIFYMPWDQFQTYAAQGFIEPYADELSNAGDFLPALAEQFSYDGQFYCAPKDFSTLGLQINLDAWEAAGLTDADIPTDWDQLATVAQTLTTGEQVGLSMGREYARVGVFMNQAGGSLVDGDTIAADSPENAEALEYLQGLIADGSLKFPQELEAGWGGEAFGLGKAAMVIEGPWINGAMANDFPDRRFISVELPAGPAGPSTFAFSNCWGMPVGSETKDATLDLIEFLTSDEQQLAFAEAFGVIPSTESGSAAYAEQFPDNAAFVAGVASATSPVAFQGASAALADFNVQLEQIGSADPSALLGTLQTNLQAAFDEANG